MHINFTLDVVLCCGVFADTVSLQRMQRERVFTFSCRIALRDNSAFFLCGTLFFSVSVRRAYITVSVLYEQSHWTFNLGIYYVLWYSGNF